MKNYTASKVFRVLCGMDTMLIRVMSIVVMLAFMAGITSVPALAASNGIYIATATPHYKHPGTGKIEDAGGDGSSVLGQSMTESATYKKALVEVDPSGNTYITVRLQLMDNIKNPQFQVDGKAVSASLMQEDYTNNTADYRMKVNSENSIIRCNMYVIAMGRDVIFYITVSDLQSGYGDFIASVKVEQPKQPDPVEPQKPAEPQKPVDSHLPAQQQQPKQSQQQPTDSQAPVQIDSPETEVSVQTNPPETDPPVTNTEPPSAETDEPDTKEPETSQKDEDTALGLQEFDKNGNKVEQSSKDTTEDTQKSGNNAVVWWVLGSVVIIAAAGGAVWYFCFFKKKK